MSVKEVVAAIDIGGTNSALGLVDRDAALHGTTIISTAEFEKVEDFISALSDKINELKDKAGDQFQLSGIGIGAPNGNYYRGTIEHAPNLKWKGVLPVADLFRRSFQLPIALTNDANAAAIGEGVFGAAKGMSHYIVITLGTGVGSGIVVDGELVYGHDGFAGEIGHTTVDPNGRQCGCGRRGCLETYASAGGIKRTVFEMLATRTEPSALRNMSFEQMTARDISLAAEAGDSIALAAFDYTGNILGLKLADAVAHTSPEAIILFGGLAQAGELIFKPTKRYMEEHMLNIFRGKVKLLPSGLQNENVAILGAAALIWKEMANDGGNRQ